MLRISCLANSSPFGPTQDDTNLRAKLFSDEPSARGERMESNCHCVRNRRIGRCSEPRRSNFSAALYLQGIKFYSRGSLALDVRSGCRQDGGAMKCTAPAPKSSDSDVRLFYRGCQFSLSQ